MSLNRMWQGALAATPDKPALVFGDETTSYRSLAEAIDESAGRLVALGVVAGDRVAIFMRNRSELIELYFACFRIGAIAVPLNHRFQLDEVVFAVDHCEATVVLVDGPLYPVVQSLPEVARSIDRVYVYGEAPQGATDHWVDVASSPPETDWPSIADDHPAVILYTSGSTGKPKGVTHTHRSVLAVASARITTQQLSSDDIALAATAICHAGGSIGVVHPVPRTSTFAASAKSSAAATRSRPTCTRSSPTLLTWS